MNVGSSLYSNDLLGTVVYPDAIDGNDRVTYAYNRQGQVTQTTDQNGTKHLYLHDKLGRRTADIGIKLGTGIESQVRRIEWEYDLRGLLSTITGYFDVEGEIVANQIKYAYNDFGQLTSEAQSHSGAVT